MSTDHPSLPEGRHIAPAFDSHLHLTAAQFSDDEIGEALLRAKASGVDAVMNVTTDFTSLERSLRVASKRPAAAVRWYQAAATTPHEASGAERDPFFTKVEELALEGAIQAVGETGLDYYYEHSPREEQRALFQRYIDLSSRTGLPLIVHCRDAFPDFFDIVSQHGSPRGVLHCFTGSKQEAKHLIEMGWYVSMSGIVTYAKSARELQDVARYLPSDRILVETDAPYLAPVPVRGKKNEPSFLPHILECIAELRNASVEEVTRSTYENAQSLFGEL